MSGHLGCSLCAIYLASALFPRMFEYVFISRRAAQALLVQHNTHSSRDSQLLVSGPKHVIRVNCVAKLTRQRKRKREKEEGERERGDTIDTSPFLFSKEEVCIVEGLGNL